jgi:hypothetical protein
MHETIILPQPELVIECIEACREELAALKKLLRASVAARAADQARQRRTGDTRPTNEIESAFLGKEGKRGN